MRAAIYARYSSDNQREASIEDQVRLCRERAIREGWSVVNVYTDHAVSGASLMRPGIQQLMQDVLTGKADIVLSEALDRLSRDQEDIAGIYKRFQFANVLLFTLSEGEISNLHIGLKGTMNALFLKDLADKTRRGLRGRIEQGKSGGGNAFGYSVLRRVSESGEYARGERHIDQREAAVIRRIFLDYVNGLSPRAIATALNREGVEAPTGGKWGASTIYGNRERGTGILNNELYVGKLVWNRLRYIKDPETGKRVSRPNPESEVVRQDVPELRIVDQDLWNTVKELQGEYNKRQAPLWTRKRPKSLFSSLTKCGCCGGGFTVLSADRMGCATARNKGTCENRQTIKRDELEAAVINALRDHLMDEALCEEFCKVYTARINELRNERNATIRRYQSELSGLIRAGEQIAEAICNGVPVDTIKERAIRVGKRRQELEALLACTEDAPILFHPNMAKRYQKEIKNLIASLSDSATRPEAGKILRSLVDRIILTPQRSEKRLAVDLVGDLAGILSVATQHGRSRVETELRKMRPEHDRDQENGCEIGPNGRRISASELQDGTTVKMVAGAGFEPATFRL
jgi:site-specific DNA recombinase